VVTAVFWPGATRFVSVAKYERAELDEPAGP
jgi:hypothetical protein